MTTRTYHPPIYYKVRTVVRHVFWTSVVFGFLFGFARCTEAMKADKCQVDLNFNFTWTPTGTNNLDECRPPTNVLLHENGTWEWEN